MRTALLLGELGPRIARIDTNADDPLDVVAASRQSAANFESDQWKWEQKGTDAEKLKLVSRLTVTRTIKPSHPSSFPSLPSVHSLRDGNMRTALLLGELGPRIARIDTNADDPLDVVAASHQSAANFESERGKDMGTEGKEGNED